MALHRFALVLWWCLSSATILSSSSSLSSLNPKCQTSCGNMSIPYPFGLGQDPTCFRNDDFRLTCNESATPPEVLLFDAVVLNISLQGQLRIKTFIVRDCYSKSGKRTDYQPSLTYIKGTPYTLCNTRNKFTAIGCDTEAYVSGYDSMGSPYKFGCMSACWNTTSVINGSCTGIGCCQSSIPPGLNYFAVKFKSFNNHTEVWSFNPCSYAFFVEDDFNFNFYFSVSNLSNNNPWDRNIRVPAVLDWVASNETCQEATRKKPDYACLSKDSECVNATNGPGYRCRCSPGYDGNPYTLGGCQDINECQNGNNTCKQTCINIPGSYHCKCRKGFRGDGWNNGTSCVAEGFPVLDVTLGTSLSMLILVVASTYTYWFLRKRRSMKLKEKFFQQNGGLMLQQKIGTQRGDTFKIFTARELERATNNYNASTIVGQGGFGIVYKGVLPNNRIVAIKKSKIVDSSQIEQFINELDILSQVNHRNVVKLLGCCLDDQVPSIVYEFISNGTLYHHIHDAGHLSSISLENRLRIATEIAEALAYLHSSTSMPIIHRDVKSVNILLDNNFTSKVSDFGLSRLVPIDHTQITTLVQGTCGYLDPESFQTGILTDKSDVYSFGVVLVELLTGEKAVCLNRSQEDKNLAMFFVHAMKKNRIFQILEERVRSEGSEEQLMAAAQLAMRCLKFRGEERPTMKEVAADLLVLRGSCRDHPWINNMETERLMCETSQGCAVDASRQYSMENQFDNSLTSGR